MSLLERYHGLAGDRITELPGQELLPVAGHLVGCVYRVGRQINIARCPESDR